MNYLSTIVFFLLIPVTIFAAETSIKEFFSYWLLSRVWVGIFFIALGYLLLVKKKISTKIRLLTLTGIIIVFVILPDFLSAGFFSGLDLHPSPLCIIEKPILYFKGGYSVPILFYSLFAFIIIISFFVNKSFCGWNCPIGAIQELVYNLPLVKRKFKIPFRYTQTIRILVFISFLVFVILFGISIYSWLNPFEFLHWEFTLPVTIIFIVTAILSLILFRPFCYLLCPIGLMTWFVEQFSIKKIKFHKQKCNDCKMCLKQSPCPAISAIIQEKKIVPDCHLCGKCLQSCDKNALEFK